MRHGEYVWVLRWHEHRRAGSGVRLEGLPDDVPISVIISRRVDRDARTVACRLINSGPVEVQLVGRGAPPDVARVASNQNDAGMTSSRSTWRGSVGPRCNSRVAVSEPPLKGNSMPDESISNLPNSMTWRACEFRPEPSGSFHSDRRASPMTMSLTLESSLSTRASVSV